MFVLFFPMSDFTEYSNEPSVSLKREFYSVAARRLASQEKFWSMKLVDFVVVNMTNLKGHRLLGVP
jgi:hypothetical protein